MPEQAHLTEITISTSLPTSEHPACLYFFIISRAHSYCLSWYIIHLLNVSHPLRTVSQFGILPRLQRPVDKTFNHKTVYVLLAYPSACSLYKTTVPTEARTTALFHVSSTTRPFQNLIRINVINLIILSLKIYCFEKTRKS